MLTRAKRQHVYELLTEYEQEKQAMLDRRSKQSSSEPEDDAALTAKLTKRAERAAIRERRLLSCRRTLRYGEQRRIVELRFKEIGSLDVRGLSYGKISRKLYIRPTTI